MSIVIIVFFILVIIVIVVCVNRYYCFLYFSDHCNCGLCDCYIVAYDLCIHHLHEDKVNKTGLINLATAMHTVM